MAEFIHKSVLSKEVLDFIEKKEGIAIDATVGLGGHSLMILRKFPKLTVLALDQDEEALDKAKKRLKEFKNRIIFQKENFRNIEKIARKEKIKKAVFILADLGVSSLQLDKEERGFSFKEGPLDMRMNLNQEFSAINVVNQYGEEDLANLIFKYGEERFSRRIARRIVERRNKKSIQTTKELREIINSAIPNEFLRKTKIDPATKTFQAIRIEVNNELESLEEFLQKSLGLLEKDGRLAVISFHSLEDRIVKKFFKKESKDCICPKEMIICQCQHKKTLKILTKKPIQATLEEIKENPRSRSAKLRVAEATD